MLALLSMAMMVVVSAGFTNTLNPLPEYQFSWTANAATSKLSVQVIVTPPAGKTMGWVGFGIAGGGGGMLGADMFTAYSTGGASCAIQDRMADDVNRVLPAVDTDSSDGFADWTLDSCSLSGGVLTVAATRAFATFDAHDLDFVSGPMTLVFVWGQKQPSSASTIEFHDGGYVPKLVSLWGEAVVVFDKSALESDYDVAFIGMPGVPIGPDTTYTCQGFNLTQKGGNPTHAIAFEPVVSPIADAPYVHHMVLYTCSSQVSSTPFSCFSMPSQCTGILYAWGKGGGPFVLPQVTGVEIGSSGRTFVALQMHYNNPTAVTSLQDSSGVNIYRTNMLRAQPSGMLLLGTNKVSLPAKQSVYTISGACTTTATALLPTAGVTAYASFMHAHQRGRRIWTDIWRNGTRIGTVGNNQNYDFNLQKVQSLSPTMTLSRGDTYSTFCTYDTSSDNTTVTYGETTNNEMCFNFVAYYPIIANYPTYPCMLATASPNATACSLLPTDPPAAYQVSGLTPYNTYFWTGGSAKCNYGFKGTAVLGCSGNGAPFSFSGCVRDPDATQAPTPQAPTSLNSAALASGSVAVLVSLALVW